MHQLYLPSQRLISIKTFASCINVKTRQFSITGIIEGFLVQSKTKSLDYSTFVGSHFNGVEILRELGRGSSSVVYLGNHEKLRQEVAVKIIPKSKRKTFKNEIEINTCLDHPHIVPVIETGETDNHYYIIMEVIRGFDLSEVISKRQSHEHAINRTVSLEHTFSCIMPIIDVLISIHERGIVHCDIKPANILIDPKKSHVYLSDFGIALHADDPAKEMSTIIKGSPLFIAPEQIKGVAIDHRADIYAVGITMLKMLLGFVPSRDESSEEIIKRKFFTPETFIDSIPADSDNLDTELCNIILKTIAPYPEDRYENATQLKEVLLKYRCKNSSLFPVKERKRKLMMLVPDFALTWPFIQKVNSIYTKSKRDKFGRVPKKYGPLPS